MASHGCRSRSAPKDAAEARAAPKPSNPAANKMPVAADHVKKERAPGVLESLDQLRADRKKAVQAAKPKYITHDPGYAAPELVPSVRKTKPKKQKVVHTMLLTQLVTFHLVTQKVGEQS